MVIQAMTLDEIYGVGTWRQWPGVLWFNFQCHWEHTSQFPIVQERILDRIFGGPRNTCDLMSNMISTVTSYLLL
jgi:hypothetical protein